MEVIVVDGDPGYVKAFDSPLNSGGFNGRRLSFKSLFEKRALWRRIFFSSKKLRSIILLNAITIVYGKVLNLRFLFINFSFYLYYCSFYFILLLLDLAWG